MLAALRRLAFALVALALLGGAALGFAYPILPAALCPACFGLQALGNGMLVQQGTTPDRQTELAALTAQALHHVTSELGPTEVPPRLIFCTDADCAARLGLRNAAGLTISTPFGAVVYIAPHGARPEILRHELAHVVIHHRAGLIATLNGRLPAWLDEGLAVIVSDDPAHLHPGAGVERCAAPPVRLVANPFDFARAAAADPALYTRSACAALQYEAQLGGRAALLAALDSLRDGALLPDLDMTAAQAD
ncbi:hypothetical protein [Natronohydrobacter thiooxidans]|uniref:hypothetical protein n=1 Tax=Natronohydrobacter thiooxidans TaxID=87172 RepID=UPI0008FF66D7|nr:hypothetical protein [Natronohydrobacter thiooxidans]